MWSSGSSTSTASGLLAGSITLTISDANNCNATDANSINEPAVLAVSLTSTDISCIGDDNGSSTAVSTGGSTPYTYAWSNGNSTNSVTGLSSGNIAVTISDVNGCSSNAGYVVNEPTAITISTAATNASSSTAADGTATATANGGTGAFTYAWSNGAATATSTGLATATYTVTATDSNGCSITASQLVDFSSTIIDLAAKLSFEVFPNPNKGSFVVNMATAGDYTLSIKNILGEVIYLRNTNNVLRKQISLKDIDSGVYFLTIRGDNFEQTKKVVINH